MILEGRNKHLETLRNFEQMPFEPQGFRPILTVALRSRIQSAVCAPKHSNTYYAPNSHRSQNMGKSRDGQLALVAPPKGTEVDVAGVWWVFAQCSWRRICERVYFHFLEGDSCSYSDKNDCFLFR